jgi:hypothetical protein
MDDWIVSWYSVTSSLTMKVRKIERKCRRDGDKKVKEIEK